jgi:hypothetical protein
MQHHGELASDCDPSAVRVTRLGHLHALGPQGRPFLATHQQRDDTEFRWGKESPAHDKDD